MKPASIATLTLNPALDESTSVPELVPDRKMRCSASVFHPGGGGINVARAIRNLGGRAVAVFPSGGSSGRILEDLLRQANVEVVAIPIANPTRENLNVTEESTGRQYRFCKPGPQLSIGDWTACIEAVERISPLDYLVLSGSLPPGVRDDFYGRTAADMARRGTRVVLDASSEALIRGVGEGVFLLKASLSEFEALTGCHATRNAERLAAGKSLIERGCCRSLVVSLGAQGALWVSASDAGFVPGLDVPASSGVGAGDSLVAGVVLELSAGAPLADAVRFGVATGCAAVMNAGTELCRLEDVERLRHRIEAVPA